MKALDQTSTLAELVLELPSRTGPLDMLGVDYCCAGEQSLAAACSQRGLNTEAVALMLETRSLARDEGDIDLKGRTIHGLCELLEQRWHASLLPLLDSLRDRVALVAGAHQLREPKLARIAAVFGILRGELRAHISIERRKLFPLVRALEKGTSLIDWLAKDLDKICLEMSTSRAAVVRSLVVLRGLSNNFTPPSWACRDMRSLFEDLRKLSALIRRHAHARNNALIPQARALLRQQIEKENTKNDATR